MGSCQQCPKTIPYLDCKISVYQQLPEDGSSISQLKTTTYSKPTDVHHYIPPSSCTPNLSSWSPAIIKGVAHRLRLTNMMDTDLLISLNNFSGYLEASGYDKATIITYFTDIMKVSNRHLAFNIKEPDSSFKVALVTKLHPALPSLSKIIDQFYPIIKNCSTSSIIFPRSSLITAHRKLPTLSTILVSNPFNTPPTITSPRGFHQTPGCKCKLCKEATFASFISPSGRKERGFSIPSPINCMAINIVYAIGCPCGRLYVGKSAAPKSRWANHKSHIRKLQKTCNLATHCADHHAHSMVGDGKLSDSGDIRNLLHLTLLESVGQEGSVESLERCEEQWRNRLQSWAPNGLNTREDGPQALRKKQMRPNL